MPFSTSFLVLSPDCLNIVLCFLLLNCSVITGLLNYEYEIKSIRWSVYTIDDCVFNSNLCD